MHSEIGSKLYVVGSARLKESFEKPGMKRSSVYLKSYLKRETIIMRKRCE